MLILNYTNKYIAVIMLIAGASEVFTYGTIEIEIHLCVYIQY